jgi:hypothetical protein
MQVGLKKRSSNYILILKNRILSVSSTQSFKTRLLSLKPYNLQSYEGYAFVQGQKEYELYSKIIYVSEKFHIFYEIRSEGKMAIISVPCLRFNNQMINVVSPDGTVFPIRPIHYNLEP